jgi:integrase
MPRRNSKHLTDPGIEKMRKPPQGQRVERFDAGVEGLCLRITGRGVKSWCVYYHFPNEDGQLKHHRITLGRYPALKIAQAREEARRIKDQASSDIDPKATQASKEAETEAKRRGTFSAVAERYISIECPQLRRGQESESIIRRELIPHWGPRMVSDLHRRELTALTDELIAADKPMAARRLYETAKRVLNWAMERGDINDNPLAVARPPVKREPRERALKHSEIQDLWAAWDEMGYPFGAVMKLLLLTGQRRSEVAEMLWSEIDLDCSQWAIPKERSKSKREHIVPLSAPALSVLNGLPHFGEGAFVFTTTDGARPVSGFSRAKVRANDLSGVENWRLHDLRRTVRTEMARLGVPEIVGERVLNHLPQGLTKTYNIHHYLDEKQDALARWAQELMNIIEPPPANVVPLEAQR